MTGKNIGLIGYGSIGQTLARAADDIEEIRAVFVYDRSRGEYPDGLPEKVNIVYSFGEMLEKAELVIEAASQEAVAEYATKVLMAEKDLMVMSVGAFACEKVYGDIQEMLKVSNSRLFVPSGAIAGIDGLFSAAGAEIDCVELTTTKPPEAFSGTDYLAQNGILLDSIIEPTVLFSGSARDACQFFPKNINVAASVSLAGIGFDRTEVTIIADPAASRNQHRLKVSGDFGMLETVVENVQSPDNPKTSFLAALSAVSGLRKTSKAGFWLGL